MRHLLLILVLLPLSLPAQVTHVTGACSTGGKITSNLSTTFTCTPNAANHAIVFFVGCGATGVPTGCSLTASGWTITALDTHFSSGTEGSSCTFAAIAPNTSSTTFTFSFSFNSGNCNGFMNHLNDEFSGNDTTGGATSFYAHNKATGTTGGCQGAAVTSNSANDMVWGACNDNLPNTNWQGSGWSQGQKDSFNDGSEYKSASGSQTPVWASTSGAYAQMTIVIKASGTAIAPGLLLRGVGQ